ncbi:MAG: FHA domain-containing protein [Synergistaceae bacterium]|jgi:hypothetical protein|nr:FHA domain-containing protein [Synergistaceae bacterium]
MADINDKVRICPTCEEVNQVTAIVCGKCGNASLADVPITLLFEEPELAPPLIHAEPVAPSPPAPKKTAAEREDALTLICTETKRAMRVVSGSELGREAAGRGELFPEDLDTVSRRHARIVHNGVHWELEDLGSVNGTYINSQKIEPGKRYSVKNGDILNFSRRCTLKVVES